MGELRKNKYEMTLPNTEKYDGRMEKLTHYLWASSPEQALVYILFNKKRNLGHLYEELRALMGGENPLVKWKDITPEKDILPEKIEITKEKKPAERPEDYQIQGELEFV